jgi:hypothetical protein
MKRGEMLLAMVIAFLLNSIMWAHTSAQAGTGADPQASVQTRNANAQVSEGVSASGSAESKNGNSGIAAGTTFNAALVTSLDSKKAKTGDEILARTTENVRAEGKTVLPKGTKLVGHITQASARAKGDAESSLGIAFDHAVLKTGEQIVLNLTVQAVASAQTAASGAGSDMSTMSDIGGGMSASGETRSREVFGGTTSALGSGVGATTNTVSKVGDAAVDSTLNSASDVAAPSQAVGGLNASGQLAGNSRGVFNLNGLSLNSGLSSDTQGSVVTSSRNSVHLDSGTRMLLVTRVEAPPASHN